ncbi:MipA/OmpV family protein [Aliikangiella sp. IMCC44632]
MRTSYYSLIGMIGLLLCHKPLATEVSCETEFDCASVGSWSFGITTGVGVRTNPLADGKNIPLVLLPAVSYYGENFFIDNLDVGYTFYENQDWAVNALITPAYDRIFFNRWDIQNIFVDFTTSSIAPASDVSDSLDSQDPPLNEYIEVLDYSTRPRKTSIMGGLELNAKIFEGDLQLNLLQEVTKQHHGSEVRLAYAQRLKHSGWTSTLGFTWKSAKMTNYYYGLELSEISPNQSTYTAKSSLNPFIRISWKELTQSDSYWRFAIEYQKLDSEISRSPIVSKNNVMTIFIGKHFDF